MYLLLLFTMLLPCRCVKYICQLGSSFSKVLYFCILLILCMINIAILFANMLNINKNLILSRDLGESFSCYFEAFFDVLIGRVCHQNIIKSNNTTELVHPSPQDSTGEKSINNDRETISTKLTLIEKKRRNLNSDEITKLFECLSFLIK